MEINQTVIEHVAGLARLNLSLSEKTMLTEQMQDILRYVDKLGEMDTQGVQPTAHVLELQNVFRKDEVLPSFERDLMLQNAPSSNDGCYMVPKVIE